jgi:adenosylhomocysteine nucleosidase
MKYEKIGVICAMEKEAAGIREKMDGVREEQLGTLRFWIGKVGSRQVILALCGIGKVFAAMCAQTMILRFEPEAILNSGVAGSLTDELDILSLAVSEDLVQHDMDTSPLGDPVGLISGLGQVRLPAEETLWQTVLAEAKKRGIPALSGTIASGDQFIAKKEQKERIRQHFSPIACEMEGAAIAQVALANKVPCCVIRSISDSYSGKNEMDYSHFAQKAADRGAEFLLSLLANSEII